MNDQFYSHVVDVCWFVTCLDLQLFVTVINVIVMDNFTVSF